jgi:hypothetical protein
VVVLVRHCRSASRPKAQHVHSILTCAVDFRNKYLVSLNFSNNMLKTISIYMVITMKILLQNYNFLHAYLCEVAESSGQSDVLEIMQKNSKMSNKKL